MVRQRPFRNYAETEQKKSRVCRHRVLIKDKNKRRNDAAETALIEQHTKELIQCENIITVNYIVHFANDPVYTPRVYNKHTQFTIQ